MDDELIKIWQSSPEEEKIKFEKSRLMIQLNSSLDRFHRLLNFGILTERIAAIIVIPIFSFYVYYVPFLLSKIASVLIVLWVIWYMFRLRAVKKLKPSEVSESYLEYLYQTRTYLRVLKEMGDTGIYWYILPSILGALLFITGYVIGGVLSGTKMVVIFSSVIGLGVGLYFYMKWITKKLYSNRLSKVEELIAVMEE